jgi:hypothetical protein
MREALERFISSFIRRVINHAWITLALIAVIVAAAGFGISRLAIDSDMLHWFDRKSPIAQLQYYINDTFKVSNPIIVMLQTDDVFRYENVRMVGDLSKLVKENPEVGEVLSLTAIDDIRSTEAGIVVDKLYPDTLTNDQKFLDSVRDYVMSKEKYNGTFVSSDGKSAAIVIEGQPEANGGDLAKRVKAKVNAYLKANRPDVQVFYSGTPSLMNSISGIIVGDMKFLLPLVSALILLALFFSFRHPYGTLLPLFTVILSTVASMGIMGYLGFPVTPIGIAIPVVLMAIGNAYGIYIINEYHEKLQGNTDKKDVVYRSTRRLFIPVTMSGLTVFAGFISLVTSSGIRAIIDFSVINAIGVLISFVLTLTFIPALLTVLPLAGSRFKKPESEKESKILKNLAKWIEGNKVPVLIVIGLLTVVNLYFATKVTTDSNYIKYFKEGSEPRTASEKVNAVFNGSGTLELYFKADATDPRVLKTVTAIEENSRYHAGSKARPDSIVDTIAVLNANMTQVKRLPDTQNEINNLWFFIEGNDHISRIVGRNKDEFTSSFLLPLVDSRTQQRILSNMGAVVRAYDHAEFVPNSYTNPAAQDLSSVMLYNRLVRRGIPADLSALRNGLGNAAAAMDGKTWTNLANDYARQKLFLEGLSKTVRSVVLKGDERLSSEDLDYSLSPLLWNEIPVPSANAAGAPVFAKAGVSGIIKLFSDMDKIVVDNQVASIFTAVLIVMALIALMFRSVLSGVLSVFTMIFTIVINFGFMGMMGIRLNFITVTVASITIGAGIDYTIQYMARYFHEINVTRLSPGDAFVKTVSTTGRAILSNALAVGLGFLALALSNIVPLRDFGIQMFVTMFTASFATITMMPVILLYFNKFLHPQVIE